MSSIKPKELFRGFGRCFRQFLQRNLCCNRAHRSAVFESHDSSEGNEMIEIDYFIGLFQRAAKAMEDPAQFIRIRLHDLKRVIPSVALMNYDIEPKLDREIELLLEYYRLLGFVSAVFDAGVDLLFR